MGKNIDEGVENVVEWEKGRKGREVWNMNYDSAFLSNKGNFTVFRYGNYIIRFKAPYSLEKYTAIKECDNWYLVVMAKYKHNQESEEEYIDLIPILEDLYILPEEFLKSIKEVKIENDWYYKNCRRSRYDY